MTETNLFVNVNSIIELKWWWFRRSKYFDGAIGQLNLTCAELVIDGSGWASRHSTGHPQDVFTANVNRAVNHYLE
jgi:hypothetical protein